MDLECRAYPACHPVDGLFLGDYLDDRCVRREGYSRLSVSEPLPISQPDSLRDFSRLLSWHLFGFPSDDPFPCLPI